MILYDWKPREGWRRRFAWTPERIAEDKAIWLESYLRQDTDKRHVYMQRHANAGVETAVKVDKTWRD